MASNSSLVGSSSSFIDGFSSWMVSLPQAPLQLRERLAPQAFVQETGERQELLVDRTLDLFDYEDEEDDDEEEYICTTIEIFQYKYFFGFSNGMVRVISIDEEDVDDICTAELDGSVRSIVPSIFTDDSMAIKNYPQTPPQHGAGFLVATTDALYCVDYDGNAFWEIADPALRIFDTPIGFLTFYENGRLREIETWHAHPYLELFDHPGLGSAITDICMVQATTVFIPPVGVIFCVLNRNWFATVVVRLIPEVDPDPQPMHEYVIQIMLLKRIYLDMFVDTTVLMATDLNTIYFTGKDCDESINGFKGLFSIPLEQVRTPTHEARDRSKIGTAYVLLKSSDDHLLTLDQSGFMQIFKQWTTIPTNQHYCRTVKTKCENVTQMAIAYCFQDIPGGRMQRQVEMGVDREGIFYTRKLPVLNELGVCDACIPVFRGYLGLVGAVDPFTLVCCHYPF